MDSELVFLKPNVQIEPLFDRWYAWSHLIPPATAARNVSERHLKIMESYIAVPQVHAAAVKNPRMLGGPFIDYGGQRVEAIKALRIKTLSDRSHLLELSTALSQLTEMLTVSAKGFSLQPLYCKVPDILKGYVELVYDLNNNPSFRIIESLMYRSRYYDRSAQGLMLSLTYGDERPFILSTPRLDHQDSLYVEVCFDDPIVDELFRMKTQARSWKYIRDTLSTRSADVELLRSFFTAARPSAYRPFQGRGARWRYFGHACVLVEASGLSLLFDPVISYSYPTELHRYTYADLPDEIDYALITHNHQDHILFETLLQIRHKVRHVVVPRNGGGALQDPSIRLILQNSGFANVIELDEMESIGTRVGSITALPFLGEHADLNVRSKTAYLIKIGHHSLLFAADSCNIEPELYEHIHRECGNVDALFLGMECDGAPLTWLYGPLLNRRIERAMDESRRLAGSDYNQGIRIVNRFKCKEVYIYAMGQEPWLNYVMSVKYSDQSRPIVESNKLIEECRLRGLVAERLFGEKEILLQG